MIRGLVDGEPEPADLGHLLSEIVEVHRAGDEPVGAAAVALQPVLGLAGRGEHDDGDVAGRRVLADPVEHLEPVQARKLEIQQNQLGKVVLRLPVLQRLEPVLAGLRDVDVDVDRLLFERADGQVDPIGIILDEQDPVVARAISLP